MPRGERWLVLGRLGSAVLLASLALFAGDAFRSGNLLFLAAGCAVAVAILGWAGRTQCHLLAPLFLADVGWISLAVVGAGRVEAGLGMLFALVAFASGMWMGGRLALAVSLVAGLALMATVNGVPDLRVGPSWVLIQGLLVLVLGAASDSTRTHLVNQERALRVASQALEKMRLDTDIIVENLSSAVLSVDSSGRVVLVNRVASRTLGLDGEMLRGQILEDVMPPGIRALGDILQRGLGGESVQRCEIEIQRGSRRVPLGVGTTVLVGPENETTGVAVLFQDLTEIRKQELLERRRDRLAAVGELAAGIAHEIRNSVLPISGSVQILAQELSLDEEQARLFDLVSREMDSIERFVSDLLRYTRSQELHLESIDLAGLVREMVEEWHLAGGKSVDIGVEGDSTHALVDTDQIRQAIRNLIMNASDAVADGGRITVRTGTGKGRTAWVEVEDDGPGVTEDARYRVFDPFYTSKPGGTGLGLAIVSRIVEDHEGRLELLDGAGGGARFRIVLDAARGDRADRPEAA